MTSNLSATNEQRLKEIGYNDSLPMSIRATLHYKIYREKQILGNAKKRLNIVGRSPPIPATTKKFPITSQNNFELMVDDDFLTQQRGIKLHDCHHFKINFSEIHQLLSISAKFFIEINNCTNFIIENADIVGGRNIIAITASSQFLITKSKIQQAEGYAIIIHNSSHFEITQCLLKNNLASGIMVVGESKQGLISHNQCSSSSGYFNYDAGINLCATSKAITLKEIPEKCHELLTIEQKTCRPYGIVIENCALTDNRAQGIYLEGAVNCLIRHNKISTNNKEGICFDWGSSHNIFKGNNVYLNGARKSLSQNEIAADFIVDYPILKDGSSSMKLAGISIDNGYMNEISSNRIVKNFRGGIKFVRSALLNRVNNNVISYNSLGRNKFEPIVYGISIEGIPAINKEFNENEAKLLEFLPSELNTFSHNVIRGHTLPFFQDSHSACNTLADNRMRIYYSATKQINFYLAWLCNSIKYWAP